MSQRTDSIRNYFSFINCKGINIPRIPFPKIKIKLLFMSVICLAIAYLIVFHVVALSYLQKQETESLKFKVKLDHICVHFDFKGSPPKLSYLKSLLPMLKEYKVNGLFMEYEDMFPYEGMLANLSARNAYGKEELEDFLRFAVNSSFEIIPLIQTFGHLEYALKLAEFKHLREIPPFLDSICPSKTESKVFLREMLDQVITFHERIAPLKHIHVGCDEVYHINNCEHCSKRNLSNTNLFITHINEVSRIIKELSPPTKILFWSDMLGQLSPDSNVFLSFPNIIPVYWDYSPRDIFAGGHKAMYIQTWIFDRIWVATAFKGADGAAETLPNMKNRFLNHYNWLKAILEYGIGSKTKLYNFEGMILTGWSRYSHMQAPCELLPVSIPSLMLNLILIQKYLTGVSKIHMNTRELSEFITNHIQSEFNEVLRCDSNNFIFNPSTNCHFPGSDLHVFIHKYINYKEDILKKIGNRYEERYPKDGTELELLQQGYINMNQMPELARWCSDVQEKLSSLEAEMIRVMSKYFDTYFIEEYVAFKLGRMKKDLKELRLFSNITNAKVWQQRPFIVKLDGPVKNTSSVILSDTYQRA